MNETLLTWRTMWLTKFSIPLCTEHASFVWAPCQGKARWSVEIKQHWVFNIIGILGTSNSTLCLIRSLQDTTTISGHPGAAPTSQSHAPIMYLKHVFATWSGKSTTSEQVVRMQIFASSYGDDEIFWMASPCSLPSNNNISSVCVFVRKCWKYLGNACMQFNRPLQEVSH